MSSESQPQDPLADHEQYTAFVNDLQAEQKKFPLISTPIPLEAGLFAELVEASEALQKKAGSLSGQYGTMRAIRKDGSCFIRATSFRMFELMLGPNSAQAQYYREYIEKNLLPKLSELFGEYVEDFADPVLSVLDDIAKGKIKTSDELCAEVAKTETSEYLICFFRYAISCWMRTHAEDYAPFLIDYASIEEYCATEVECVGKECDQLHITAFSQAFELPIAVEYLDAQEGEAATRHSFGPDEGSTGAGGGKLLQGLVLLYRPGHYDLLYERPQQ